LISIGAKPRRSLEDIWTNLRWNMSIERGLKAGRRFPVSGQVFDKYSKLWKFDDVDVGYLRREIITTDCRELWR